MNAVLHGTGDGLNESAEPLSHRVADSADVNGEREPERQAEAEDLCQMQSLTLLLNGAQSYISNKLPEDTAAAGQWTAF